MFRVVIKHRDGRVSAQEFDQDEVTIGRTHGNDLVLPGSAVSKHHATLTYEFAHDAFSIADKNSTNGTKVNDQRVDGSVLLEPDDKIRIGHFTLILEVPKTAEEDDVFWAPANQKNGETPPMLGPATVGHHELFTSGRKTVPLDRSALGASQPKGEEPDRQAPEGTKSRSQKHRS